MSLLDHLPRLVEALLVGLTVVTVTRAALLGTAPTDDPLLRRVRRRLGGLLAPDQVRDLSVPTAVPVKAAQHGGLAIACSGGGIRAAAFTLGGLQRLRQGPDSVYDRARRVYAVSGGSYVATSLHLARRHADGQAPDDLFGPNSLEAEWFRRRSSYLLPTTSTWFRGFFSVVYGLAVNLLLLLAALGALALYAVWLIRVTGSPVPSLGEVVAAYEPSPTTTWLTLTPLVAAAAWLLLAKLVAKYGRRALPSLAASAVGLGVGLTLSLLVLLTPHALVILHNAALGNQPTRPIASTISALGVVTDADCRSAMEQSFVREARIAYLNATPAARTEGVTFTYGACGASHSDNTAQFPTEATQGRPPQAGDGRAAYRCVGPGDPATSLTGPTPSFCAPLRDTSGGWGARLTGLIALITTLSALAKGLSGQSDATGTSRLSTLLANARQTLLPWAALAIVAVALLVCFLRFVRYVATTPALTTTTWWSLLVPVSGYVVARLVSDATVGSLHPFYKERLARAFFIRRRGTEVESLAMDDDSRLTPYPRPPGQARDAADYEQGSADAHAVTALDPQLSVLCAANIADVDYIPARRGCASFRFETSATTPYIGFTDTILPQLGPNVLPAEWYSYITDPSGNETTLATAAAASGAAFSPLVGRMQSKVRPYRFLLTLANARLGVWLPNPYLAYARMPGADTRSLVRREPSLLSLLRRRLVAVPGPLRIFKEAFGQQSILDSRIYVSDGGHFDNTGIVEALRDRPRMLVVLDASADAHDSLEALTSALTTARMDLGLVIEPSPADSARGIRSRADTSSSEVATRASTAQVKADRPERPWLRLSAAYADQPGTEACTILFVKNVLSDVTDLELDTYQAQHPEFPITTTINQFYGEYDFEAYRQLGWLNTDAMLRANSIPTV